MKRFILGFLIALFVGLMVGMLFLKKRNDIEIGVVEKYENGGKKREILKKATYFNTSCGKIKIKNSVWFHKTGKIDDAYLSEPQFISTPVGKLNVKRVTFYDNGKLHIANLSKPQRVKTPLGKLNLININFYDSGEIKFIVLLDLMQIEIQTEKINTKSINFYKSGQVHLVTLNRPAIIDSQKYKEFSLIELDKTGKIIKISQGGNCFGDINEK